jgi:hypothetical protein
VGAVLGPQVVDGLFTRTLRAARRSTASHPGFPPQALDQAHASAREEILFERLPRRRLRAAPRVVKRKMSSYGVKRAAHRAWSQPTVRPEAAIAILNP